MGNTAGVRQPPRVVLVTGGSRGIGAAVARGAAQRGWSVAISYRDNETAAREVVRDIEALGRRALAVRADVGVEAEVLHLYNEVDRVFGGLGALVNNAGVVAPASPLASMEFTRMAQVFQTNVLGAFLCAREAVRRLSTRLGHAGGVIVNVSSAAARLGSPNEYVDYAASKAALDTLTVGLSRELAREGVRVNAVRPGLIDTELHASGGQPDRLERLSGQIPMGRAGSAREVADAILYLMGDESTYVTGALLDVGGGR